MFDFLYNLTIQVRNKGLLRRVSMDIRRKAYDKLLDWKNSSSSSKAIMVKGARRVGKSFLVEGFAKNEYKTYILIDFASPPKNLLNVFKQYGNQHSLDEFFNQLSVLYSTPLIPGNSVIIFDEVQKYTKARELIKYLVADGRYDFIETGSLISIKKNVKDIVIPSEEQEMLLYPLDFEEFLEAISDEVTFPYMKESYEKFKPFGNLLKPLMDKYRTYMLVGGMPQAVVSYAQTKNIEDVERTKRGIIKLYREDIAKYAEGYIAEATAIFDSIPAMLSHHDKKIKYSSLSEGDRFSDYKDAIHWLDDSMVGNIAIGTDSPDILGGFTLKPSKLKCYMGDTGLLLTLATGEKFLQNEIYKSFMLGKLSINQGMLTENMVAQMLLTKGHALRFYEKITEKDEKKKKYEVDFLINDGKSIIPIEVKSGKNHKHISIDYYTDKYRSYSDTGIIFTKGDLRIDGIYRYLPLPMACLL